MALSADRLPPLFAKGRSHRREGGLSPGDLARADVLAFRKRRSNGVLAARDPTLSFSQRVGNGDGVLLGLPTGSAIGRLGEKIYRHQVGDVA